MARLDYRTEKSRWELEQARLAPPTYSDPPEEAEDDFRSDDPSNSGEPQHSSQMMLSQQIPQNDSHLEFYDLHRQRAEMGFAPLSEYEADIVLRQESEELEALIEMMESQQLPTNLQHQQQQRQRYLLGTLPQQEPEQEHECSSAFGSDDEEYDSIFMDLIDEQGGENAHQSQQIHQQAEEMDMS